MENLLFPNTLVRAMRIARIGEILKPLRLFSTIGAAGLLVGSLEASTVISEDFSSGASNFSVVSGGTWGVSSGRYVLSSPASSSTAGVLGNISVHDTSLSGDFELSATMHITGSASGWNDAAIVFGYQDSSNYYYVSLNESNAGDTKGILKVVDGTPTQLADITIAVVSDTDYLIEIFRSDSSIVVHVDSAQVASASDSTFTSGKIGLGSYNDGAQFDDLVVLDSSVSELFSDDFNDGNDNGWTTSGGSWSVSSNEYLNTGSGWSLAGSTSWDDYIVQADVKVVESTYAGVYGRVSDVNNSYHLEIHAGSDVVSLWKRVSGSWTQLDSYSITIDTDTWYELKLEMDGNLLTGYLDGVERVSATDSSHSAGQIALRSGNDARFDNVIATEEGSDTQAPSVPTGLAYSNLTSTSVDLDWNASTDNVGVAGYYLYTGGSNPVSVTINSITVVALSPSTSYSFTVSAYDAADNESSQSSSVNFSTPGDTEAPSVPTGLDSTGVDTTSVDLVWNSSSDNVGVVGYKIYTDGSNPVSVTTGTSTTVTGLSPNTSYTFTVSAYDAASNESSQSSGVNVTTDMEMVSAPQFSPAAGTYSSAQSVAITTDTSGATIRYTTDGSTPTSTTGTVYSSAVSISSSTVLKAIAYKGGMSDSTVHSGIYTIGSGTELFNDDFDDGNDNGWTTSGGTWSVSSNEYLNTGSGWSLAGSTSWDDYIVQADVKVVVSTYAGIYGRVSDVNNSYHLEIHSGSNALSLWKRVGGSWTQLGSYSTTINTGTWYELKLEMNGSTLKGYLDGVERISVTDTSHSSGQIAVRSGNDARFDNIVVNELGGPADTEDPSVPTGLAYSNVTTSTVDLDWNASTDNIGVTGYNIYTNGSNPVSVTGTSVTITGLSSSTSYSFTVTAYDAASNESSVSSAVNLTTGSSQSAPQWSTPSITFTAGVAGSVNLNPYVSGDPTPTISNTLASGSLPSGVTLSGGILSASTGTSAGATGGISFSATNSQGSANSPTVSINIVTAQTTTSITQFGITWNFTNAVQYGQFANGDYWVVDNGSGVQISSISPGWNGTRNGTMINVIPNGNQGFDTRISGTSYSASLNIADDLPYTVNQACSVVSCISVVATQTYQLDTMAVLTVLDSVPASGSFRPPYAGTDKTIIATTADLDYTKLQSLDSSPVSGIPSLSAVEAKFERPWLDFKNSYNAAHLHPISNMETYGRDICHDTGEGGLMLNMDFTNAQKETLLIRYVQLGIDIYGLAENGHIWLADGGHKQGRKLPLLIAGWVLQNQDMLDWADASQNHIFQEDLQTDYVSQALIDITNSGAWSPNTRNPNYAPYVQADLGKPEWAIRLHANPELSDADWGAYYRGVNNGAGMGTCITAYVMGLTDEWGWPAFFDYHIERVWPMDSGNPTGYGGNSMNPFPHSVWENYGPSE